MNPHAGARLNTEPRVGEIVHYTTPEKCWRLLILTPQRDDLCWVWAMEKEWMYATIGKWDWRIFHSH